MSSRAGEGVGAGDQCLASDANGHQIASQSVRRRTNSDTENNERAQLESQNSPFGPPSNDTRGQMDAYRVV